MTKKVKKSKKFGRNSPCPCGSGLKYKKCCGKIMPKYSPLKQLEKFFEQYNKLELVSSLGGLQTCPENHSQIYRLEIATRLACKNSIGTESIDPDNFKETINNHLSSKGLIGIQEDPSEGLFTDNIMFSEGNYTVYSGLSRTEPLIVQNLLTIIFLFEDDFPKNFRLSVYAAATCLLTISDEITKRNNQFRYNVSPNRWREDIEIPVTDKLHKVSKSMIFSQKELENIIPIDPNYLTPFILPIGHQFFNVDNFLMNPLFRSPIVKIGDKFVVALPGSITATLRHFILIKSQQYGVTNLILEKLKDKMWFDILRYLDMMSMEFIDIDLPLETVEFSCRDGVFRIDTDKLCYALLITDDLTDYNLEEPFGTWDSTSYAEFIDQRCEFITQWLIETIPDCNEVLILIIFGQIGRYGSIQITKQPLSSRIILMNYEELSVLAQTRECDNLTLWKFAKAADSLNHPIFASFLDQYAFYLNNKHSFYLDDPQEFLLMDPNSLPNLGRALRIKVANLWDTHAAAHITKPNAKVERLDENIPIYYYEVTRERLVEGYFQPIWVGVEDELYRKKQLRGICWDITSTISYWLWQLTPSLQPHLKPLGNNPIHIIVDLENPDEWMHSDLKETDNAPNFSHNIDDFIIHFKIPREIVSLMLRTDNLADRLILDKLLVTFNLLLKNKGISDTLNASERQRILDIHAPLGIKKHFLIINPVNGTSLNPENIPNLRKIQEHDIEEQLNGLVAKLGDKSPPVGVALDKKVKVKLCDDIVDMYYYDLKSILPKYKFKSLLDNLIGNNESICNKRANKKLKTGPAIGCYFDIQSKVEKDLLGVLEIERTALATRALIEIIAAEPPNGDQEISMEEMDQILAISYHIINWAMIRDDIHLDLTNVDLRILDSGRVGINKEELEDVWDPFRRSKTLENVELSLDNFKFYYKPENNSKKDSAKLKNEVDPAFKAEFGLSLTQIVEFNSVLINISFEQKSPATFMQMSKLKDKIKKELDWSNEDFYTAINIFSLEKREKWEVPPIGFETIDIWPWRYNRQLSYLRRPLIINSEINGDDPLIFWGPRHVEEAERNLVNLVMSGQYNVNEDTPEEMRSLVGSVINENGKKFNNEVKDWLKLNTSFELFSGVPIAPRKALNSNIDLGDVDVLAIDEENKIIFSIECKNIFYGRNPRQMKNEIEKFIGEKEEDNSWVKKHSKRHEWLVNNLNIVKSVYNLGTEQFQVLSIILTAKEIPITYIRDLKLPFISFTSLKRKGVDCLYMNGNI